MKSIQKQPLFIYRRTGFIVGFLKLIPNCLRQKQVERTKNQEHLMQKVQGNMKTRTSETVNWFPVLYVTEKTVKY